MRTTLKITVFITLSAIFASCGKYEEGPGFSLRSRTERVANTWKLVYYGVNGTDLTSTLTSINFTETYDKDGDYSYSSTIGTGSGKWAFQNGDKEIKRNGVSGASTETLMIIKLKEKEFWYYYMDGNDRIDLHFEQK